MALLLEPGLYSHPAPSAKEMPLPSDEKHPPLGMEERDLAHGLRVFPERAVKYKGGTVFFYQPPEGRPEELVVIVDGGPLCVGRVFDHNARKTLEGLYWIYLRKHGAHFGPFFAEITLAEKAMKKILKEFKPTFFEQPLEWIRRQMGLKDWMEKNIGKNEDLIGGEWIKDEKEKE